MDFTEASRLIRKAAAEGLADAAEVVKQEAVQRAPLENGELRNSAGTAAEDLEAVVYFDTPYAVRQHEEVGYHHQDGQAKYLENAVVATQSTVAAMIATAIGGVL